MIGIKPDHFPVFGRFMDTNFYLWTIIFIHGQEFLFGEKYRCRIASYISTAPAIATLSDSACPRIGM